ncbi:MAG: hypothetical protein B6U68_03550 [Candidatus Aenigmarchaeota archaeon ex4484_14]|nr:MAG: hypothetical protein B6U68_03550 [Candidatus Aenigmarchaeota archaeon ex4484_14]
MEACSIIDVLRRAEIPTTTVGLTSTVLEGAHNIKTIADKKLYDVNPDEYSAIILPGGNAYKVFLRRYWLLLEFWTTRKRRFILAWRKKYQSQDQQKLCKMAT